MSALDRLKQIQSNFKRQWNGIDCSISGRVGTSNFVNKKRTFIIPETYTEEEERQRQLNKIFTKLKEFEDDPYRPSTTSSGSGVSATGSASGVNAFNKTASAGQGNGANPGFFANNSSSTASGSIYGVPNNGNQR